MAAERPSENRSRRQCGVIGNGYFRLVRKSAVQRHQCVECWGSVRERIKSLVPCSDDQQTTRRRTLNIQRSLFVRKKLRNDLFLRLRNRSRRRLENRPTTHAPTCGRPVRSIHALILANAHRCAPLNPALGGGVVRLSRHLPAPTSNSGSFTYHPDFLNAFVLRYPLTCGRGSRLPLRGIHCRRFGRITRRTTLHQSAEKGSTNPESSTTQ